MDCGRLLLACGCLFLAEPALLGAQSIHDLQGTGVASPYVGQSVGPVLGYLTASVKEYLTLEDPKPDSNLATSEALFLQWPRGQKKPAVGTPLAVWGTVKEVYDRPKGLYGRTTLVVKTWEARPGLPALPPPLRLSPQGLRPPVLADTRFWMPLEGMRVEVSGLKVTSLANRFGEVFTALEPPLPDSRPNTRGGYLRTPQTDGGEILVLGPAPGRSPSLFVGARFTTPLQAVVDYSYGQYRLRPTANLPPVDGQPPSLESAPVSPGPQWLTVATFNIENFHLGSSAKEWQNLILRLKDNLRAPDLLLLQEVQDDSGPADDGTTDCKKTIASLCQRLLQAGGPSYQALWLNPVNNKDGGAPGGNIRPVILYNPTRVQPLPGQLRRLAEADSAFQTGRKPLWAAFSFRGQKFAVIDLHLVSKLSDPPLYSPARLDNPWPSAAKRLRQVQSLLAALGQQTALPTLLAGDFNDSRDSQPLRPLLEAGWKDAAGEKQGAAFYTTLHAGMAQDLDHILLPVAWKDRPYLAAAVHCSAEQTASLRVSDHDPVWAAVEFP